MAGAAILTVLSRANNNVALAFFPGMTLLVRETPLHPSVNFREILYVASQRELFASDMTDLSEGSQTTSCTWALKVMLDFYLQNGLRVAKHFSNTFRNIVLLIKRYDINPLYVVPDIR